MQVVLTAGALDGALLTDIPDDAYLLYCTLTNNGNTLRWTSWAEGQDPPVAMEVDPGEYVYVYALAPELNPNVQVLDGTDIKTAVRFVYTAKSQEAADAAG